MTDETPRDGDDTEDGPQNAPDVYTTSTGARYTQGVPAPSASDSYSQLDDDTEDYYTQFMRLPVHIRVQMAIGEFDVLLRAALAALRGETTDDQRTDETDGEQGQDASGGESRGNGSTDAGTMDS